MIVTQPKTIKFTAHNVNYELDIDSNKSILGGAEGLRDSLLNDWEKETFQIFEYVQNKNKNAIDIGGWIGPTAIWLSNGFKNLLVVESDRVALSALKSNLTTSNCNNVTIIDRPIYHKNEVITFGTNQYVETYKTQGLGNSTSQIKTGGYVDTDYQVETITLSDLDKMFPFKDVGFIKVDIEGGEEFILLDLIHYAELYNLELYVSFHRQWWKNIDNSNFRNKYHTAFDKAKYILSVEINKQFLGDELIEHLIDRGSDSIYFKF
jgi:FkbM family methyltransferase